MLRKLLLNGVVFIATPAHACLGYFAEYRPVRYEPIRADVAPVVAKITVIGREYGKSVRHYVMFRVKVEQVVTGDLPGEIAMAVRHFTSCDREPIVGESGGAKREQPGFAKQLRRGTLRLLRGCATPAEGERGAGRGD